MKNILSLLIVFALITTLFTNCNNDDFYDFASIVTETETLYLSTFKLTDTILLTNLGEANANFSFVNPNDYIKLTPEFGKLSDKGSIKIIVEVMSDLLETKVYSGSISVKTDTLVTDKIEFSFLNYKDEIWDNIGNITDAVFSASRNEIIAISFNPPKLKIIDPENEKIDNLNLQDRPNSIALSKDENFAVIGFANYIKHFDLVNMETINDYYISCYIRDLVYAPNNWVYIFSSSTTTTNSLICSINLNNGQEFLTIDSNSYDIYNKAIFNSNKNSIYAISHSHPYSKILKIDISNDTVNYLYDKISPYGSIYSDFWVSKDGNYLFMQNGDVFSASTNQSDDINFITNLKGVAAHRSPCIVEHTESNKLFAISNDSTNKLLQNKLHIYNLNDFSRIETKTLPSFYLRNELFHSNARFGFVNEDDKKLYIIAIPESITLTWGVITYDIE